MKKTLFLAIFSLLALPTFAFATIDTNLKYGAKGDEVVELQEFLIDKGFLQGTATGNFFALTKKAVVSYQSSVGLPATGFVGQLTRAEINKELQNDDQAEIQETGAVSEPIKTSQTDVLKAQLDSLIAQINALKEEQKKTTEQAQQTTQAVQQVVQNTVKPVVLGGVMIEDEKPQTLKVSFISKKSDAVYLNIESNKYFTVKKISLFQDAKFNEDAPKIGSFDFQITGGIKDYVGYFDEKDNLDIYINYLFKDGKASIRMPVGYGGKFTSGKFTDENRLKGHKIILKSGDSEIIGVNGEKLNFEDIEIIIN